MFCSTCGKELKAGARFCTGCGAPVQAASRESQKVKAPDAAKGKEEKKKGKSIRPAVVAVLIVAAGAGGILYLNSGSHDSTKIITQAEETSGAGEHEEAPGYYSEAPEPDDIQADVYLNAADEYMENGAFEEAVSLLRDGIRKNGSAEVREALTARLAELYENEADACVEAGDYGQALKLLDEAAEVAGDAALAGKRAGIYRAQSDACLAAGDYVAAVQALADGYADTGDAALSEREDYLREHTVFTGKTETEVTAESIRCLNEWAYDTSGNMTEETEYFSDGYSHRKEYDGSGNMTWEYYLRPDGSEVASYEYEYDESGNSMTGGVRRRSAGGTEDFIEWGYDASGNLIRKIAYYGVYSHPNFDNKNTVKYWYEYGYDESGRLVSEYYVSGVWYSLYSYEYDGSGDLVKRTNYDEYRDSYDEWEFSYEHEYDVSGNEVKTIQYTNGELSVIYEYEYDVFGNVAREIRYNKDGEVSVTYEYVYEYIYVGD